MGHLNSTILFYSYLYRLWLCPYEPNVLRLTRDGSRHTIRGVDMMSTLTCITTCCTHPTGTTVERTRQIENKIFTSPL